jgi:uncharacterized repeat protein (TIGR03803 family)
MNPRSLTSTLVVLGSLLLSGCGGGGGSSTSPPPATYTIGGTVSGLSGTGLALRDNGSDLLQINANGNFTFTIQIARGGTYNVTVSTEPSNPLQVCVVANGSGTVSGNVTSVEVTCTDAYTIGGTVSGFSSTGLVLQDNGGDSLQISANGNFTFATPVVSGGTYNVTVSTQPYTEICVVANGIGTANADVTDIQVICASAQEQVLYGFGNAPDGRYPAADLVFDGSGNLYGTTSQGGTFSYGTVFKLTPGNGQWNERVVYSFCSPVTNCDDGATPLSSLILDAAGNLYGATSQGGAYGASGGGVVFELSPNPDGTWTEMVLHSFGNGTDGIGPSGRLVFDSAGNLYGTTSAGGTGGSGCFGGCGTAFELIPSPGGQWAESVLYNFCSQADCADGNDPAGGLTLDAAGNLYGTTKYGGTPDQHLNGTVFELTPGGNGQWTQTVLYMFQNATTDGNNPLGGVVQDKSGNLYGTTSWGYSVDGGMAFGNGIVFELSRGQQGQWTESILHPFCSDVVNCSDGSQPLAGLVFDKAGNLYGTTSGGGDLNCLAAGCGVVFELAAGTWSDTILYSFPGGTPGFSPDSSVILDAVGNLYGVAYQGGTNGYGVVYEVIP